MRKVRYSLTFDFWLPWMFGFGSGWGQCWFDFGLFTLWWSADTPKKGKSP